MRIPLHDARSVALESRSEKEKNFVIIAIIVIAIITILIVTYLLSSRFRQYRKRSPKKSKDGKLPNLLKFKWPGRQRHEYSNSLQDNEMDRAISRTDTRDREMAGSNQDPERQDINAATTVDRHTSVRSIMTLPPYSSAARENEQVLGREGERGGVDVVIELPETQDEEEARRDDEMESLYQIRLARRQEAREREERRQQRREARARGDYEALAEIRRRAETAAEESISQALIVEHQTANRDRRVSSVQYHDLGVARHDGSRVRANSTESDNRPLLDSAASISGQSGRSRALSNNTLHTHYRAPSATSVVSSRASDEFEFPDAVHTRSNDTGSDFEVVSLSHPRSRSASRAVTPLPATSIDIPREEAPAYEDPPNYESPVRTRAPQLPPLEIVPSIQVTTALTPVEGRNASPR